MVSSLVVVIGSVFAYRLGGLIPGDIFPSPVSGLISLVGDRTLAEGAISEYVMAVYVTASMIFICKKKYTKSFGIFNWPKSDSRLIRDQIKEGWRVKFFGL